MDGKKEINVAIGANIKRAREKAGFTQEEFSEMIGLGPKSLSAAERGTVGISLSTLQRICRTLSVSSDSILFDAVETNDVAELTARLKLLSPRQFKIANEMVCKLLEAFSLDNG